MADEEKQEGQKTVVSFIAGLLIGGLLVWAFSGSPAEEKVDTNNTQTDDTTVIDDTNSEESDATSTTEADSADSEESDTTNMEVGAGSVSVAAQEAGMVVTLQSATFPTEEGWVGVRTYDNGEFLNILGVSRYSEEQGLVPQSIQLLTPTIAGEEYAVVFFQEDGDRNFNPAVDVQLDTELNTFVAE